MRGAEQTAARRGGLFWILCVQNVNSHEAHLGDGGAHLLARVVLCLVAQRVVKFILRARRRKGGGEWCWWGLWDSTHLAMWATMRPGRRPVCGWQQ